MNMKYQRIVSSNLLGYSRYLNHLPKDELLEAKEENKKLILNTNKFWKFAKDESKSVSVWTKCDIFGADSAIKCAYNYPTV